MVMVIDRTGRARGVGESKAYRQIVRGPLLAVALAGVMAAFLFTSSGSATSIPAGTSVFPETNHAHVTGHVHYNRTPPAGGPHSAVWLNCGVYNKPVANEHAVHSLEHGSVWITYQPGLGHKALRSLQHLVETHYVSSERYVILSPYPGLPAPLVASAWGAQLQLASSNDPRIVKFIRHFAGGAQGGEQGAPCTGGIGSPIG